MSRARLLCRSLPGVGLIEQTGPGQEQFVLNFLEANVVVPLLQGGLPKARRDAETLTARRAMRVPAVRSEARLTVLGTERHFQNDHEPLTDLQAAALLSLGLRPERKVSTVGAATVRKEASTRNKTSRVKGRSAGRNEEANRSQRPGYTSPSLRSGNNKFPGASPANCGGRSGLVAATNRSEPPGVARVTGAKSKGKK